MPETLTVYVLLTQDMNTREDYTRYVTDSLKLAEEWEAREDPDLFYYYDAHYLVRSFGE